MIQVEIAHTTRYRYDRPVSFSAHQLFLYPRENQVVRAQDFSLETYPASTTRWVRDCFENVVLRTDFGISISERLEFTALIQVRLRVENPFDFILDPHAMAYPMRYHPHEEKALGAYLSEGVSPGANRVLDWFYHAVKNPLRSDNIVSFLSEINAAIFNDITYQRRDEMGIQTPDETLEKRSGSCRDMAVLMIALCRQLGLAARFVSGYLYDPPAQGGEHSFNRAHGSMHAWVEVYLPGAGWKGFDPTNGILTNHFFIPTAVSSDPAWVNPVQGRYYHDEPVSSHMEVELNIRELP
ncbi:transglutaminase family protein [Ruficoccus amylovorans]|uniref:Transglutaminase family protein n=1 Tax=Ruficoccus amylovorans TaxID=1804625 RepID=A0A842HEX5_9BACT|nr:transglutaminase family protein [Ruficoccus amylovorans]MBC2594809.1 transglutaminase family protein [Ruficoccus amylovorans]